MEELAPKISNRTPGASGTAGKGVKGDGFDEIEQLLLQTVQAESPQPQSSFLDSAIQFRENGKFA